MNITFANHPAILTPEGAIWFPELSTLCVADLHFEKGSFFSRFGTFLPPYDTQETLTTLTHLIDRYAPQTFIAAGDSFHDRHAAARMPPSTIAALNELHARTRYWYWLSGNHDPKPSAIIPGLYQNELEIKGMTFCHQATRRDTPEISGHYHPKVTVRLSGHRLSAPCFAIADTRLILPSFGRYTGGLNVDDAAFQKIIPKPTRQLFIRHADDVYAV